MPRLRIACTSGSAFAMSVPGRAHGADDELERRLHLGAVGLGGEELRRRDDGAHDFADVAVGVAEAARGAIDERLRRLVGDEAPRELRRDEPRGRRMAARANRAPARRPSFRRPP